MTALEAYKELTKLRDQWDGFHGELIPKEAILVAINVLKREAANDIQQLIKSLRQCGSTDYSCFECAYETNCNGLETDAADVIERLMKEAGYFEDHSTG